MLRPDEVLRENRSRAQRAAEQVGLARLRPMLERAQRELEARIARAEGLRGAGKDSFTAVQARVVLRQVEDVLRALTGGVRDLVVDQAVDVSAREVAGTVDYLRAAEQAYRGSVLPLSLDVATLQDQVRSGAQASALRRILTDPSHKGHRGVLDRYGESVVGSFERALQQRVLQKKPWAEVRDSLVAESPFLQQAPAHWAERIVRTEVMHASNYGARETIVAADDDLGDVLKVLSASFDARTGADSYAVHGQIRRAREPFDDWTHSYEHPPNRPNDREVVVPHRTSWPLPAALKPKSDAEVAAAWAREGRKGSPPPRPRMSTVDLAHLAAQGARPVAAPVPPKPAPDGAGDKPVKAPHPPPAPPAPVVVVPKHTLKRHEDGSLEVRDADGYKVDLDAKTLAVLRRIDLLADSHGTVSLAALGVTDSNVEAPPYLAEHKAFLKNASKVNELSFNSQYVEAKDLEKITFTHARINADRAAAFASDAHALDHGSVLLVRHKGRVYLHEGVELLLARRQAKLAEGSQSSYIKAKLLDLDFVAPPKIGDTTKWVRERATLLERTASAASPSPGSQHEEPELRVLAREVLGTHGIPSRDRVRAGYLKFDYPDVDKAIVVGSPSDIGGALANHTWSGKVNLTHEAVVKAAKAFAALRDRDAYEQLGGNERNELLDAASTFIHEELHGASSIANSAQYKGVGIGIEESLTEILARKLTRELAGDHRALALPARYEQGQYHWWYAPVSFSGSYDKYITGLLNAVDRAYDDGHDVGARVEAAALKTRQRHEKPNDEKRWTAEDQIDAFVDALKGLSPKKRAALKTELKDPARSPLIPP